MRAHIGRLGWRLALAMIATLDPTIAVYPGHGPPTNIGAELSTNPYLADLHHVR